MKTKTYKFSELFKWQSGKVSGYDDFGNYPVFGSNGIVGYCDAYKFENKIIIGRVGAYCGSVEYCENKFNATDNTLITTCDETKILYKYAYYLLNLYKLNSFASGSAQPLITQGILKHLKCNIPDIKTQNRIINILKPIENKIDINNKLIDKLNMIAENFYHKMFNFEKLRLNATEERLGNLIKFQRGISYSSEEINCENGIGLVNLKNINSYGGYRRDGLKMYNGKYKESQIVKNGDLIMGITDMTQDRRLVGSVALIPTINNISVISADLIKINSKIDNIFMYAMFKYGNLSKHISQFANGANVLHLKPDVLNKIKILLPSDYEIKKYVRIARPIIEEIDNINIQNDILKKQFNLLLSRIMSGKKEV